jgi:hypothetical protein
MMSARLELIYENDGESLIRWKILILKVYHIGMNFLISESTKNSISIKVT